MGLQIYSAGEIKNPPGFYYQSMSFIPKKGMTLSLTPGSILEVKSSNRKGITFQAHTIHPVWGDNNLSPIEHTLLKYDGKNLAPFDLESTTTSGKIEYKHWLGELSNKGEAAVFQVKFQQGNKKVDKNMAIVELEDFQAQKPILNIKLRAFMKEADLTRAEESFVGIT